MALIQFNRAVRIATKKGGPKVYAAGSVQDISDPEVLKHPHFLKFQKDGALEVYSDKGPKRLAPATLGKPVQSQRNPSAVDGRVKPESAPKVPTQAAAAATTVIPETVIGDDAPSKGSGKKSNGR